MKDNIEKSLKRFLKRKVKITLGVVVAFLVGSSLAFGEGLFIQNGDNGADGTSIEFSIDGDIFGENPYPENTFENESNVYTNNIELNDDMLGIDNNAVSSMGKPEISIINNGRIKVFSDDRGWGIQNIGRIKDLKNNENIEVNGVYETTGIGNYDGTIENVLNNRIIKVASSEDRAWGIDNQGTITDLTNTGNLEVNGAYAATGIGNYGGTIENILNDGEIKVSSSYGDMWGINNNNGKINNITNNGNITVEGEGYIYFINNYGGEITGKIENNGILSAISQTGEASIIENGNYDYLEKNDINEIINNGIMKGTGEIRTYGINNIKSGSSIAKINKIENNGLIDVSGEQAIGIYNSGNLDKVLNNGVISAFGTERWFNGGTLGIKANGLGGIPETINRGIIEAEVNSDSESDEGAYGISMTSISNETSIVNDGIIKATDAKEDKSKLETYAIYYHSSNQRMNLTNNGVIFSDRYTIADRYTNDGGTTNAVNNGLLIGDSSEFINKNGTNNGMMFSWNKDTQNYKIQGREESKDNIMNAALTDEQGNGTADWTATGSESFKFEGTADTDKIYNGITNTIEVNGIGNSLTDSTVNGYTSAIVFGKDGGELKLNNTLVNGGLADGVAAILGSEKADTLTLENAAVINGEISLGNDNDTLSLDDTVQINDNLFGGEGADNLIFTSSSKQDKNINVLNKVDGFENITVETDVTLFENSEVTGAENINLAKDGNLVLRIDGANNNSHALSGNTGTIHSDGGKLLLALNGVGEGAVIDFGNTTLDDTMKGNEIKYSEDITIDTTSLLHNLEKNEAGNQVTVKTVENLPLTYLPADVDYSKLNDIYQSIRSTNQVKEFKVTDDKTLSGFNSYLHDIYAANPYAFSSELSRKSAAMFSDIVMGRDLHPEVNKWAVYGGFTHIDGGTKDTYFGKGYYTYDIGSKDIDVDSKITGIYGQGEYGLNETLNVGVIFGGNQSESELNNGSKVEGDSFYIGTYAKKYIGNLRLLAGAGYQYGDYEADRTAAGYNGITADRNFSSDYNDNTFTAYVQAKYSNKLADNLYLEPSVALDYTYVDQEGASEKGTLAIETEDKNFNYTTAKVGVDLRKDIPTENGTHSMIAGVYYNRMLDGYEEENITGRFVGGSDFDILVSPKNKHELGLRAKYEVNLNNGVTFDVKGSYTFERDSYNNENKNEHKGEWTVGAGIGYKF